VLKSTLLVRAMDDPPRIKRRKRLIREAESGHAGLGALKKCRKALFQQPA
jgi:hypothetical protein